MHIRNAVLLLALSLVPTFGSAATQETPNNNQAARLEIAAATVGKPAQIRWLLSDPKTGKNRLSLAITQLEKGTEIFSVPRITTDGSFVMSFQFADGSAHQVRSVAEIEGKEPIINEEVVTVRTVEPPAKTSLPALILFLAVIASGLAAGRFSRRWA